MKILALEFSSPQRSVACIESQTGPGHRLEQEAIETGPEPNRPFQMIEQVLNQGGIERETLERIVVGLGPGSYTGIRAAIAMAQGWQLASGVQLEGISSAKVIAAQAQAEGITGRVAVVIDAQRGEFYLANFELTETRIDEVQPLRLVSPRAVEDCESSGELLVGPEVSRWFPKGRIVFPRATTLARLATGSPMSGSQLEPIYLRATTFVKAPPPRVLPG